MFHIEIEKTDDVAVLQCYGRIVRGPATCALREGVTLQRDARIIVLDLSAVESLDGGGLGTLVYLHDWTRDHGIQLKLVNPTDLVREMLDRTRLSCVFDISSVHDALLILGGCSGQVQNYALAS